MLTTASKPSEAALPSGDVVTSPPQTADAAFSSASELVNNLSTLEADTKQLDSLGERLDLLSGELLRTIHSSQPALSDGGQTEGSS